MDEIIQVFIDTYLHDDIQTEVRRSFDLFDFYDYKQAYSSFIDILTDETNQSKDDMRDNFINELNIKLNYVLEQHTIVTTHGTTIHEKNELLLALAHIQDLKDYTPIIRVLESLESNEEQLANILADLSMLEESKILNILDNFSPTILKRLRDFIYAKEKEVIEEDLTKDAVLANLKDFNQLFGEDNVGVTMLTDGVLTGARYETYLPYMEDELVVENDLATAKNILSTIYMSSDGYNSPLLVYRKYSYRLIQDLNKVSRVEVLILDMIAKITELQGARNEQARISQASS